MGATDSSDKLAHESNLSSQESSDCIAFSTSSEGSENENIAEDSKNKPLPSLLFFESPLSPNDHQHSSNLIENICSKSCGNSCSEFVKNMKKEDKLDFAVHFKGASKDEVKNKLLSHLKSQKVIGFEVHSFICNSHSFCTPAFSHISGISTYLVTKVLKDFQAGKNQYIHGSTEVPRRSHANVNFISWMVCYSELHGQSDPEKLTTVLPAFLNKSELFKIYQAEAPQPHVKSSTFYYLFRKEFGFNRSNKLLPNIRISKYSSHSKASHKNTSLLINFDMCVQCGGPNS